MAFFTKPNTSIRSALIKLLVSLMVLIALVFSCFSDIDTGIIRLLVAVIFLLALPITVLLSIDASRVIKREMPSSKSERLLGAVLGFPQAILGSILFAFGIIYPFIGIQSFVIDMSRGEPAIFPFVMTFIAFIMLGVGFYYLREGLGLSRKKDENE